MLGGNGGKPLFLGKGSAGKYRVLQPAVLTEELQLALPAAVGRHRAYYC
jgi:hypothetical protein